MTALGMPNNSYYVLDIETWIPNPQWLLGWLDAARASRFGGSGIIYGSSTSLTEVYSRTMAAADPSQADNLRRALFWIAAWHWNGQGVSLIKGGANHSLLASALPDPDYAALLPPAPNQVVAWQYACGCGGGLWDQSVLDTSRVTSPGMIWSPKAPKRPMSIMPLVSVKGEVTNDAFFFPLTMQGPGGTATILAQHKQGELIQEDTGAFELALTEAMAQACGLPNEGNLTIRSATGTGVAYKTTVPSLTLGTGTQVTFTNVHGIVSSQLPNPLFGLRFFINRKLGLVLNPLTQVLTIFQAG
jgi:hypothetical protein